MDSVRVQEIERELAKELGFSVAPLVVRGKEINHEVISYNGERKYATVCEIALWRALISTRTALEQAQQQVAQLTAENDKARTRMWEADATLCGHDHEADCNCDRCAARRLMKEDVDIAARTLRGKETK